MRNTKNKTKLKIRFYFMSLWLLFLLVSILAAKKPETISSKTIIEIIILSIKANVLTIASFLLSVVSFVLTIVTKYEFNGVSNPPYKIIEIKNENYEYLTFLSTCIIPLACIDLKKINGVTVLIILLIVIGAIFVKMNLYYGNPTLALLGYKIYRVKLQGLDSSDGTIIITKNKLTKDKLIKWIPLDENVWFAKEIK
ncbi:MAG: hypothetical protein MJ147_00075 [Clostridia bacterium]|nr:hypothetical protein [Clostridia bacterium]